MSGIVAGRVAHTITSWGRTLDQIFVVLPTGVNGVRISRGISRCPETITKVSVLNGASCAPRQLCLPGRAETANAADSTFCLSLKTRA